MLSLTELHAIVDDAYLWECLPEGIRVHLLGKNSVDVTNAEVAQLDRRLPLLLRTLTTPTSPQDKTRVSALFPTGVSGTLVSLTLGFWRDSGCRVRDIFHADTTVSHLRDIDIDSAGTLLTIRAYGYATATLTCIADNHNVASIQYATDAQALKLWVHKTWMDQAYPGWYSRWLAATALNCSSVDRCRYTFQLTPVLPSPALPDLTMS